MTSSTGTVVFNDAKLQAIDVVATERLGVGTLDPASNLHVVGNIHVTGNVNKLNFTDGYTIKRGANVTVFGTTDVIQEITGPHARESAVLKKYPEVSMRDYTYNGYTVSSSSDQNITREAAGLSPLVDRSAWCAFDNSVNTFWQLYFPASPYDTTSPYDANSNAPVTTDVNNTEHRGHWIKLKLPTRVKLQRMTTDHTSQPERWDSVVLLGSNDDTNWYVIKDTFSLPLDRFTTTDINSDSAYMYILLVVKSLGTTDNNVDMFEIGYYGYEEVGAGDDSVDTTVKSVYNAPDLTSAALYIDAAKTGSSVTDQSGSTPSVTVTATGVTYDSSENAWELTGAATSNIVSGNLGFEGDQPHSVSAWVKADVLNGDGLFHVGTAEGEGDAASRVGFVDDSHISWGGEDHYFSNAEWHNVTYTYNGEGSDKKLYLDGRLVGTAANEDTFGDYPPFAMSTYSQYGYTVSTSLDIAGGQAWEAFANIEGNVEIVWQGDGSTYSTSTRLHTGGETTTVSGTGYLGDWIQMDFPHKMYLSYVGILPMVTYGVERMPGIAIFAGSNDATTWTLIRSITKNDHTAGNYSNYILNSNTCYKYIRIIWNELTTAGSTDSYRTRAAAQEIKFYGHRENDLVRFPDSVNVLKYPHMAMAAPVHRGYAATASSYRTVGPGDYRPHKAFNKVFNAGSNQGWNNQNTLTEYNGTDYLYNGSINLGTGAQNGEWIKLELPRKILMTSMTLYSRDNDPTRAPEDFIVYGSNDDSNWSELLSEVGATPADTGTTYTADTATTYYKYFALVVRRITGQNNYFSIDNIEYIGTEEDLDVIARVGDGYDGKIRNLRVFSTALSDARVQEIFDADKDEFGLAKSSVSVYRGHLGVGTTEPKAALTVMDEVAELEEFPPRAMDGNETYIEGHGVFKANASSYVDYASLGGLWTQNINPWEAFNKTSTYGWVSTSSVYSNGVADSDSVTRFGILGEWLEIEMPSKIKLNHFTLSLGYDEVNPHGTNTSRFPKVFNLHKSNDGVTWTTATEITTPTAPTEGAYGTTYTYNINESEYYNRYLIQVKQTHSNTSGYTNNSSHAAIGEWRLFGTREQGASTLHNGELSLTRNLTVPRIGPPLDADDTPRRERLVVEYNTSTNPTENGVVKDTSGRGLDGLTYNGASYDASEKALVFDGSNDYVFQNDVHLKTGVGGVYSASVWVRNRASSGTHTVYSLGTYAQLTTSTLYVLDSSLQVVFYNSDLDVTYTIPKHTWTNIVVTHAGGPTSTTTKMYINGVDVGLTAASGTSYPLSTVNFPSPCNLFLGKNSDNSVYGGPMDLSNFKLYDVVLTADDAKRLYDMGRCDEGHHVVNFSKTRVGIGLGDGEPPRAALDVRGSIHANGGQSWPVPTAVFSNVTPSNTGSSWYSRNIGTHYVHYNTIYKSDSSGTIGSPALNTDNITLYRTGMYEIYTESCLQLQGSTASHIGMRVENKNVGGSLVYLNANGHRAYQSDYRSSEFAIRTHTILVTVAPVVIAYYLQPAANRTDRFMERGYGNSAPMHTVYVKYLG